MCTVVMEKLAFIFFFHFFYILFNQLKLLRSSIDSAFALDFFFLAMVKRDEHFLSVCCASRPCAMSSRHLYFELFLKKFWFRSELVHIFHSCPSSV